MRHVKLRAIREGLYAGEVKAMKDGGVSARRCPVRALACGPQLVAHFSAGNIFDI